MITDMLSNKNLNPAVTSAQSCLAVPKNIRLNSTHYFIKETPNKRMLKNSI